MHAGGPTWLPPCWLWNPGKSPLCGPQFLCSIIGHTISTRLLGQMEELKKTIHGGRHHRLTPNSPPRCRNASLQDEHCPLQLFIATRSPWVAGPSAGMDLSRLTAGTDQGTQTSKLDQQDKCAPSPAVPMNHPPTKASCMPPSFSVTSPSHLGPLSHHIGLLCLHQAQSSLSAG